MKRKIIIFGAIFIAVLAGASLFYFLYFGNPSRQILAQVNDEKITVEQFNKEVAKVEDPLQGMFHEEPLQFLEGMITKRLLLQEAKKQGFSAPVKTFKDAAKDSLPPEEALIIEFIEKKFSSPPEVTPKEIEGFYSLFKSQMGGKTLKEVAPIIEQILREGKQRESAEQFIKELRNMAKIEIDQGRIKKISVKPPESNTDEDFKKALNEGKPFLVDFGANSCIPCRQMRPILKEVDKEYAGKTKALIIDVYKYQDLAMEYKIQLIPTLVFFDSKGKEVFRHVGVLDKKTIVAKLKEIGMGS
jgi:thioredoxin 1